MYFFIFRTLIMGLCVFVVTSLSSGCQFKNLWSLLLVVFLFGTLSSAIYFFSIFPRIQPIVRKIFFFYPLLNTFLLILLSVLVPGFHLASSTTALWLGFLTSIMFSLLYFFAFYGKTHSSVAKKTIKQAKARVLTR